MKDSKFRAGDIILAKSRAGKAIPPVKLKLVEKIVVPERKGNNFDSPGYTLWKALLVCEKEVKMLKKRFQIPYSFPDDVETTVFDCDIIKKIGPNKKAIRRRRPKAYVRQDQAKSHKS